MQARHNVGHISSLCAAQDRKGAEPADVSQGHQTGLPLETLQAVGEQLTAAQPRMALHHEIEALLQKRRGMVAGMDARVDFAFGELLAFGTLSLRRPRGAPVSPRLSTAADVR